MAIQARQMNKNVEGNTTLELEPDTGEAFIVKNIAIENPASNLAIVKVKNSTILALQVGGSLGNQFGYPIQDEENVSVLGKLIDDGLMGPIPVPEGDKLIIENVKQAGAVQSVIYDIVEPGDISTNMVNHPRGNHYQWIQYGETSSAPTDGDNIYDSLVTPVEFPSFPFENDVPGGKIVTIKGLFASDVCNDTSAGTNQQKTKRIKFVQDRTVLFDDDRQGLVYLGPSYASDTKKVGQGYSRGGYYSDEDERLPLIFDQPLTFEEGENLDIYVNTVLDAGAANLSAGDVRIGLITEIEGA